MNKKTVATLLLSTLIILVGASESLARPQYLTSLNEVYNGGLCNTCHVIAPGSGMRDFNGTGNSYGTLFESQPNHATDPGAALITIGSPPAASEAAPQAGTQSAPGFGIVITLVGLFAYALVAKRHNK